MMRPGLWKRARPLHRRSPETALEVDPGQTRGHGTVSEHKKSYTKCSSGLAIMSDVGVLSKSQENFEK